MKQNAAPLALRSHDQSMKTENPSIVDELTEKYQARLARAQKSLKKQTRPNLRDWYEADIMLFQKWAYRVGKGWYGFSFGPVPRVWRQVLDDFLEWLEKRRPDFEIHQVKMKARRLRLYLGTKTDFVIPDADIRLEISKLEQLLSLPEPVEPPVRKARKKRQPTPRP